MPSTGEVLWTDLKSHEYRDALGKSLDSQRADRYAHLSDDQYKTLRALCLKWSHTLVIDGAEPTKVQGYEFDIELEADAKPARHQLPKLSPQEQAKERYHIQKEEALGHLRIPTDAEKSDWATRTHVVSKKG